MEILIIKNNHTIINWNSGRASSLVKYQDCMSEAKMEILAGRLTKTKKTRRFIVTLLGLSLYCGKVFAATTTKGPDTLMWMLLNLVRQWAKPILIIWCIVEVIRSGLSGDGKKTLPILLKFVVIFASMYLIPELFDTIEAAFR